MVQQVKDKDLAANKKSLALQKGAKLKSSPPAPLPAVPPSLRVPAPLPSVTAMVAAEHSHNMSSHAQETLYRPPLVEDVHFAHQRANQITRSQTETAGTGAVFGMNATYSLMDRMEISQRAMMQQNLNPVLPDSGDDVVSSRSSALGYQQRRAALLQNLTSPSSDARGRLLQSSLFGPSILNASPVQNSSYLAQLLGRELPQPLTAPGIGQRGLDLAQVLLLDRRTGQDPLQQGTDRGLLPQLDRGADRGSRGLTQAELMHLADLERQRRGL